MDPTEENSQEKTAEEKLKEKTNRIIDHYMKIKTNVPKLQQFTAHPEETGSNKKALRDLRWCLYSIKEAIDGLMEEFDLGGTKKDKEDMGFKKMIKARDKEVYLKKKRANLLRFAHTQRVLNMPSYDLSDFTTISFKDTASFMVSKFGAGVAIVDDTEDVFSSKCEILSKSKTVAKNTVIPSFPRFLWYSKP